LRAAPAGACAVKKSRRNICDAAFAPDRSHRPVSRTVCACSCGTYPPTVQLVHHAVELILQLNCALASAPECAEAAGPAQLLEHAARRVQALSATPGTRTLPRPTQQRPTQAGAARRKEKHTSAMKRYASALTASFSSASMPEGHAHAASSAKPCASAYSL
jgi:hypothetical protein